MTAALGVLAAGAVLAQAAPGPRRSRRGWSGRLDYSAATRIGSRTLAE